MDWDGSQPRLAAGIGLGQYGVVLRVQALSVLFVLSVVNGKSS